ncbi:penicillin-binding protein 2 [Gemmatimonas sp. UBA7669]|uniref:penicillin-binding protein 2 n=1 Tax=Gemmatimonas sp. UBA7669 TaxID=1946568 RepID=UPI0025C11961|nr:penicillin-binding protein 2 [Gemmatimonas sp. UBA7669]
MSNHPNAVLRRARVARGLLIGLFLLLGGAFFRAQVLENETYLLASESNRLREVPLPGARGIIYDRNGEIIAENLPGYSVSILSPTEDSLRSALRTLATVVDIDSAQQELAVRRFRKARTRPAVIFNDASFQIVSVLEERRAEFPGLIIQNSPKRYYPDGPAVAALVGYTGEISDADLAKERYESYKAGQQIGKQGLEAQYEELLRAREGQRFVEVDARNRVVRDNGVRPEVQPEAPPPLRTNIDIDLQRYAHEYYGDSLRGAVVALDPKTGGVLALYSAPSYDINRFIGGIPASYYNQLLGDKHTPLYNRAVAGTYAPASTWKLATAIIGMERGLVTMGTRMPQPCTGGYWMGRVFKCWDKKGHGDITLAEAIAKSCDVYFYQLGLRIGLDSLLAGGVRLRFDRKSGVDLPFEKTSTWPDTRKYFDRQYGARGWNPSVVLSLSIGQADNAQTPINMAKFYTALATDGYAATPQIVAREPQREKILNLTPEQLQGIKDALSDVVSRGTAAGAQIKGLTIAGKTGTAQVNGQKDNAWFVGYAPADNPKIVVAIIVEEGLHGSSAARVATKLMERYLKTSLTIANTITD